MSFEAYDDRGVVDAPSRRVPNRAMAQGAEADVRGTPARDAGAFERWDVEKANERARSPSNSDRRRVERGAAEELRRTDSRAGSALGSATRRAIVGATETALLPYRGARALSGGRLPELSAEEAYAQAESLARDEPVAATRERQSVQDAAHPDARNIGDAAGQVVDPFLAMEAMKGGLRLRALGGVRGSAPAGEFADAGAARMRPTEAPVTASQIAAALERQKGGMRTESLDYIRGGGKVQPTDRIRVEQWPGQEPNIGNGRHRMTVARERGEDHVVGDYVEYGPRGGRKRELRDVRIPLLKDEHGGARIDSPEGRLKRMRSEYDVYAAEERARVGSAADDYLPGDVPTHKQALERLSEDVSSALAGPRDTLGQVTDQMARGFIPQDPAIRNAERLLSRAYEADYSQQVVLIDKAREKLRSSSRPWLADELPEFDAPSPRGLLSDDRGFAEWRANKVDSEAEKVLGTPRPDAQRLVGSPRFASGGELKIGRDGRGVEARAIADEGEAVSTFRRDGQGRLVVEDNYLEVPELARQEGQGREIMANKLREYDRLGADRVQFEADFDGRYVWPHLGYQVDKPTLKALEKRFNEHLESVGEEPIRARRIQDISEHPEGKDFLLDGYTEPFQMHLDLGSREADALRKRLGVPSNRRSF